jgi:hypothetical protein
MITPWHKKDKEDFLNNLTSAHGHELASAKEKVLDLNKATMLRTKS